MSTTENSIKYFQWVKGDDAGKVVEWHGNIINTPEGKPMLVFEDGSQGYEELLNDYLLEVESPNEWDLILLPEPKTPVQPVQNRRPAQTITTHYHDDGNGDVIIAKPPPGWKPEKRVFVETPEVESIKAKVEENVSPIFKLLTDSKKSPSTITIELTVEVPGTELMKVLSDSYPDGEEQVLQYLAENVDATNIKQEIAKQIWQQSFNNKKKQRNGRKEQAE
jgi:hypothetical protein